MKLIMRSEHKKRKEMATEFVVLGETFTRFYVMPIWEFGF